ncbi:MAG TPA: asparagine synthase (glutamine-hydrolyzing) [Chlamydiales bacterium]|nr:asparagine synthase (glutamine-hydrolyzing) [Chlamydiales bacterium]
MCGIAGLWSLTENIISDTQFAEFVRSLAHRGPDGQGIYSDASEQLRLGHRRLAILDISEKGTQPMSFANGRFWVTFNGEIYNFLELRKELEKLGYAFHSDSDTEVLLAGYIEWGEACQLKFNGMWAFAIWDVQKKRLFLSRDRFGVKPLYYFYNGKRFAFASELKAFSALPDFRVEVDEQIIANVLADGNCIESTEHTWIKGIRRLKGGYSVTCEKNQGILVSKWWNTLDHLPLVPEKWEDQVERFRDLFIDACRIRSRSDVPTGTALSGGLDSSSVLAAISYLRKSRSRKEERISKDWRFVFSALFPKTSQDESPFIQEMVEHTKTVPFFSEITSQVLTDNLDKVLYDVEEIFDLPIGPWTLYRGFRNQKTVISIDGHGADELLGGYPHYVETCIQESLFPKMDYFRFTECKQILEGMYPPGSPFRVASPFSLLKRGAAEKLYQLSPNLHKQMKRLYSYVGSTRQEADWFRISPTRRAYDSEVKKDPRYRAWGLLCKALYIDFHERTLPTILRNFDRCSMAHGVEIRAPFMDWRLVTYSFALPDKAKIGRGYTKRILRESMKGLLPESIRTRTSKVGFASPVIEWLKKDLKTFMLDEICSTAFQQSPIWNGLQILEHVDKAYKNENAYEVRSAWEFVQANRLISLFQTKNFAEV